MTANLIRMRPAEAARVCFGHFHQRMFKHLGRWVYNSSQSGAVLLEDNSDKRMREVLRKLLKWDGPPCVPLIWSNKLELECEK